MIYSGQAAVEYLAAKVNQSDVGASSHWRKYHAGFKFTGNGFQGLRGFGGCEPPYRGIRYTLHQLLQRKFRQIGSNFPDFASIDRHATEIARRQERAYDLDLLRQSLTLAFVRHRMPVAFGVELTGCVIGDGFASMTALLLASRSFGRVVLINLTKTLLVDLWYLKQWMGAAVFDSSVDLVDDAQGLTDALSKVPASGAGGRVIAIQAEDQALLGGIPVDYVMNIVSMQEMDNSIIAAYFTELRSISTRRSVHFYCCNREEKTLPDGTVTRIAEYPWRPEDQLVVDELCPWHQQYYTLCPPFYHAYDGPIRHRLVGLA